MNTLNILRKLAEYQQYHELEQACHSFWYETQEPAILPLLALAHAHLGQKQPAEETLAQAQSHQSQFDAAALADLAAVYIVMQQLDKAEDLLNQALQQQPDYVLAQARQAYCRMAAGDSETALSLFQQVVKREPQRLPVWTALIGLYLQSGDYTAVQQVLDQAIEQWLEQRRTDIEEEAWAALVAGYATLLAGFDQPSAADEALREALKHYPQNLNLISQLAELAQVQGRTMQAVQLLRRAIVAAGEQDKPETPYWVCLSSACLHQMPEQARQAAQTAQELADAMQVGEETPESMIARLRLEAKNAIAQVESQEQNYTLAETLFNEVLEEAPYFLPALSGLGQQQMQRGNIDEAVALFERIKAIDPAKGYSSLISARRFPEDEATLERMEKVARLPGMEGSLRAGLLLQVASAREKRKAYDKAFTLAVEANNANKKRLPYDPEAHRNECARIRYAFSKSLFEHRKACGVDSTLPVFVLGMPRSGTTLVEQILAGHSQIFGAGELGVIPSRIQGLNRWERHTGSGRRYPDCVDDLTPYVTEGIANGILDELRELAAEDKPDAIHVVDKLPHNFENIGLIKFLFPQAKIISVRRDPRDIAISNYFTDFQAKHGGMGFAYDLTWIGEQLADHNLMMHHWHQLFPGEILEVQYEDVVDDLEGMARKMLDYIGVEWEEQVLAFNKLERPVKTASVWQVRQPIYKTAKAKWMRYQEHLAPLIKGTNAKIRPVPVTDMLTLPVPGFLTDGVALFHQDDLDGAELNFKKLLHHNPDHAAANYMTGLVYCRKGHVQDAIPLFEKALMICPWKQEWRDNLIKACEESGQQEKADVLKAESVAQGHYPDDEY